MAKTKTEEKAKTTKGKELKRGVEMEPVKFKKDKLIEFLESKIEPVSKWKDEYFSDNQFAVFGIIGLLKAGSDFETYEITTDFNYLVIRVWYPNFMSFNNGFDMKKKETLFLKDYYIRK